jgi:epoxyqueuosine reductase QueG
MPHACTGTSRKLGKWARYNTRRALNRDADRAKRQANRLARKAEADARLLADAASLAANPLPVSPASKPAHRLRVTVEIDGEIRTFRAAYIAGMGWIGDSGNTITKAVRLVMSHAEPHA